MTIPLWEPSPEEIKKTNLTRFTKKIQEKYSIDDTKYLTLHDWSIANPELFWEEVWKDCGIYSSKYWNKVLNISEFNTNPSKDDEHKVKLLLTMKKYDKIQFKDSLDGDRYIRIGYWKPMENDDIDYVEQHSNIKLTPNVLWDDDCGWKYWYSIK